MKCAYSGCTCRTVDGGFCSEMCTRDTGAGDRREGCTCNHVGCRATGVTASVSTDRPDNFGFRVPL
jgi:hypothetical protein